MHCNRLHASYYLPASFVSFDGGSDVIETIVGVGTVIFGKSIMPSALHEAVAGALAKLASKSLANSRDLGVARIKLQRVRSDT
jgi:hypothetical protein